MCGIVYVKSRKGNAPSIAWNRFKDQSERGTDGFGAVLYDKEGKMTVKRDTTESGMRDKLNNLKSSEILLHHRYPTSTPNFREATHPIFVTHHKLQYCYYVTHNGIIRNDTELKKIHNDMGFTYRTQIEKRFVTKKSVYRESMFNDSESFAIDLALYLEGKQEKLQSKGSIAFVAVQMDKKTKKPIALFYGRNHGNPLHLQKKNGNVYITSVNTNTEVLKANTLFRIDYETDQVTMKDCPIGEYAMAQPYDYRYGGMGFGCRSGIYQEDDDEDIAIGTRTFGSKNLTEQTIADESEDKKWDREAKKWDQYSELLEEMESLKAELDTMLTCGYSDGDADVVQLRDDIDSVEREIDKLSGELGIDPDAF